jgi:hypothetical protein
METLVTQAQLVQELTLEAAEVQVMLVLQVIQAQLVMQELERHLDLQGAPEAQVLTATLERLGTLEQVQTLEVVEAQVMLVLQVTPEHPGMLARVVPLEEQVTQEEQAQLVMLVQALQMVLLGELVPQEIFQHSEVY